MSPRPSELPDFIAPMLAQTGSPFDSDAYLFEIKWDGVRTLAFVDPAFREGHPPGYRLLNRRRADMTNRYPEFAFLAELPAGTILDGEMILLKDGKPDFASLMSREHARSAMKIRNLARARPATYIVFDLVYENYRLLMAEPLRRRRERLKLLVDGAAHPSLLLSDGVVGHGRAFFREACARNLEGMVAKRLDSKYLPGQRSDAWIKIKRGETVLCAIIGFLPSGKDDFRSLIVAAEIDGELRYVGKVGTGFDMALRKKINGLIWARTRARPILRCEIKGKWLEPGLYCRVSCMERTASGHLRAPVFQELVED